MLDEKQKDGFGSPNDGFYESKREWLGRRHFILAFERYLLLHLPESFYLCFHLYLGFSWTAFPPFCNLWCQYFLAY